MFVALAIQQVKRMRHIVICGLFASTIFFNNISYDFREKKVIEHFFLLSVQLVSETTLIIGRIQRHIVINAHTPSHSFSPLCCFSYMRFVLICTVVVLHCFVPCVCARVCVRVWVL